MNNKSVLVAGFPESGKTTFLAALWHLVTSAEVESVFKLNSLRAGEFKHLNALSKRWRDALPQERTKSGADRLVGMNLVTGSHDSMLVTFPDLSGEDFRELWERRDCSPRLAEIIRDTTGVLLFVHADKIVEPRWVYDESRLRKELNLSPEDAIPIEWSPRFAPTQVQLIDLLQVLASDPLNIGPRRVAIALSAWDKVSFENKQPSEFLSERLPLLEQFLNANSAQWQWNTYGVSAQGGDVSPAVPADDERITQEVERLRALDRPSERIQVVHALSNSHDLTTILAWLVA